ncbi:MAG: DUF4276 family protein [Sulfurimonas sp.]|nr:DUF4276 family protein [Sulfurimonas sp.]MDD3060592.1 DUF4276 family protein [Sulfurimonas sp.]MDD5203510.1 DUF4276 family protein [Sulfurimonas sp.]
MKKLAIFVEGQAEEIFVEKLLLEYARQNSIVFNVQRLYGGNDCPRNPTVIKSESATSQTEYYILIYTSCNDTRVVSDYMERYDNLISNGYSTVLALRDLYPQSYEDLERVENSINSVLQFKSIPNNIHIALREVETWFLGEYTHFGKIDARITLNAIQTETGYLFPLQEYEQSILHPADTLDKIYTIAGYRYKKKVSHFKRTVNQIDYENLYINVRSQIPRLDKFLAQIDLFFQ